MPTPPPDSAQPDFFGLPEPEKRDDSPKPTIKPKRAPGPPASRTVKVAAVVASPELLALGQALPATLHLGTSSWTFPGWNSLVYDGEFRATQLARDGLVAYGKHPLMRSVSIDRTFYAPIGQEVYARYAAQVPDGFRFLVKAPMAITSPYVRSDTGEFSDSPYFLDVDYAINKFIAPCTAGLGTKCGPLVFQCPPQGRETTANPDPFINRLYRFLKALPQGVLYALEVRDPELLTERFFKCLHATGVRFCVASHARMPSPREQIERAQLMDAGPFIARWSLHSGFKYETAKAKYFPFNQIVDDDPDSRESLVQESIRTLDAGFPVYVMINNKAEGSAPLSVGKFAQRFVEIVANSRSGA